MLRTDYVSWHSKCGEKYLKALLLHRGTPPPRMHDLPALLEPLARADATLAHLGKPCSILDRYAVACRHPGDDADAEDAREAIAAARAVRDVIRRLLGLS